MYCSSIHYLLENRKNPDRGREAYDKAVEMAKTFKPYFYDKKEFNISSWLKTASDLNDIPLKKGILNVDEFEQELLNCRTMIGWLQRAIVLSYYYLLRHKEFANSNEYGGKENLYNDGIK